MKDLTALNESLSRIDGQYRHGKISRSQFRELRRELLTGSGALPEPKTRMPRPSLDPDPSIPDEVTLNRSAVSEPAQRPSGNKKKHTKSKLKMLLLIALALLVLLAVGAGVYFTQSTNRGQTTGATNGGQKGASAATSALQAELVIANLLNSNWTLADMDRFLESWSALPETSIAASKGKQRIWTLRNQVEQRLRDANDAASIDPSEDTTRRVNLLELISIRIGA